jgi:hypothetical protein
MMVIGRRSLLRHRKGRGERHGTRPSRSHLCHIRSSYSGAVAAWRGHGRSPSRLRRSFAFNAAGFAARWSHCGCPPFSNLTSDAALTCFALPVCLLYRREVRAFLRAAVGSRLHLPLPAFISTGCPSRSCGAAEFLVHPHVSTMVSYFMMTVAGLSLRGSRASEGGAASPSRWRSTPRLPPPSASSRAPPGQGGQGHLGLRTQKEGGPRLVARLPLRSTAAKPGASRSVRAALTCSACRARHLLHIGL